MVQSLTMLSDMERTWLRHNYPDLDYDPSQFTISGELAFRMHYSGNPVAGFVVNPDESFSSKGGVLLQDVYEIQIKHMNSNLLPEVKEVGGRLIHSMSRWNLVNPQDLHMFMDGSLCLCPPTEFHTYFPHGFNIVDYFNRLLVPFFYYQSYFEKYGKEPWRGYSHGDLGILESYQNLVERDGPATRVMALEFSRSLSEGTRTQLKENVRLKGFNACLCGSGRKFSKCHVKALHGFNSLRRSLHKVVMLS